MIILRFQINYPRIPRTICNTSYLNILSIVSKFCTFKKSNPFLNNCSLLKLRLKQRTKSVIIRKRVGIPFHRFIPGRKSQSRDILSMTSAGLGAAVIEDDDPAQRLTRYPASAGGSLKIRLSKLYILIFSFVRDILTAFLLVTCAKLGFL